MQRQVVQATILCLAAIQFCGCSSGFRWPWSKKPADADLSAVDPDLAVAAPAVGAGYPAQVGPNPPMQNSQLPSGYSGPPPGANAYAGPKNYPAANASAPALTQRSGYGGGFADTSAPALPGNPPAGAAVGYDTASTYNPHPSGAVYPPPAYQPAGNASLAQGTALPVGTAAPVGSAPPVGYDNSAAAFAAADNRYAPPRSAPGFACPPAQAYPPPSNYASMPPPGGAYPQGNAPYTAPTTAPPSVATQPMNDANNPYRGPRYTLTSSRPAASQSDAAEPPQDLGAAQSGSIPAQSGRYPAADPFGPPTAAAINVAPVPQPYGPATYGPPTQQYAAPEPAASGPPAPNPAVAAPVYGAPAAPPVVDNRYSAPQYNLPPTGNAAIEPIAVDTQPPVPAPTVDNHYATGDPLAAHQIPASPAPQVAAAPAAQPMISGSQLRQMETASEPAPAPPASTKVSPPIENLNHAPATVAVPPLPNTQLGVSPSRSSIRKLGKPGEPVKPKRSAMDSKMAANPRPRTRTDLAPEPVEAERPRVAKTRDPDEASSPYKNPLRDSD